MRTAADTIPVELGRRERHALADLLETYIQPRITERVMHAKDPAGLREGAERARLLAQLRGLAQGEGTLPREDAEAQRGSLVLWAGEADETTDEQEGMMADELELPSAGQERLEALKSMRRLILIDYAHATVCQKIIGQIDAAREEVCV